MAPQGQALRGLPYLPVRLAALVWSLAALYGLAFPLALWRWPVPLPLEALLYWGGLLLVLARLRVPLPLLGQASLHFLGVLGALFATASPWAALLASLALPWASRPPSLLREAFNRSQVGLASLTALALYRLLPEALAPWGAGLGYLGANLGVMLLLARSQKGLTPRRAWRRNFAPYVLTYLAVSPLAALMARLYQAPILSPWGGMDALLLLPPALLVRHTWRLQTQVEEASRRMLEGMVRSLEAKDPSTASHSERTTAIALDIAEELGLPEGERDLLTLGGKLHDIGKVGIPDAVLLKPGGLDEEEWALMRSHPEVGVRILSPMLPYLGPIEAMVLHHHERWDGQGYPKGLKGEEIPLLARILAVADTYEALTADRPYRRGLTPEEAMDYLRREAGRRYDPKVVWALERAWQKNPPWRSRGDSPN